jgi:hypothetical protein
MVNDVIGSILNLIASLEHAGFPTIHHRVKFLQRNSPSVHVIHMQPSDFIDFEKCFESFPYLSSFCEDENKTQFLWSEKPFILSFGISYIFNQTADTFVRKIHTDHMAVWYDVNFKSNPRFFRLVPENFLGPFTEFPCHKAARHAVDERKIESVVQATGKFYDKPDQQDVIDYYNSAIKKDCGSDDEPIEPISPLANIRRLEIKRALSQLAAGKNVVVPPKWRNGRVCRGLKATSSEKNVKIPKSMNASKLVNLNGEELKKLCQKHDVPHSGTKLKKIYNLQKHFCYYHNWPNFNPQTLILSHKLSKNKTVSKKTKRPRQKKRNR